MIPSFCGDFSLLGSQSKFISYLIILNSSLNPKLFSSLVTCSQKIILADGGANQYYTHIKKPELVDCLVGDFDSIKPDILEYYIKSNVKVYEMPDQDHTDLEKALTIIDMKQKEGVVCVLGGNGNRLDHNFGVYSTLTKQGRTYDKAQIFLINDAGIMLYLKPNKQYKIKMSPFQSPKGCGVITFGKVQQITTKGLKWDMGKDQPVGSLEFGGILSTSNQRVEEEVEIKVSHQAFWVSNIVDSN